MSWICPKCDRELLKQHQWHYCAKVSIDSLFENADDGLVLVFDKLLAEIADWEDVVVSTTKNCVVFVHRQTFAVIRPMKKVLDVKFYSTEHMQGDLIYKSIFYAGKFENHIRIATIEQLNFHLFNYLRNSYQML